MCAVPNMAVFCSSLTSCSPGMLLMYFLNDFEIVPGAPIITGVTFVFTLLLLLLERRRGWQPQVHIKIKYPPTYAAQFLTQKLVNKIRRIVYVESMHEFQYY